MIAINLKLGQMARVKRILDRQRVKAEMFLYPLQRTVVRIVEPDPDEIARLIAMGYRLADIDVGYKSTVAIEAGSNDAQASASAMSLRLFSMP
jgi:hypothetical protein